ncbi:unnamed protein product [Paramecium octaurelia]|uniref:Uncharacterized protein n=1 Tax=Paramecium octaurelia TaxID=43137 RepID=A0A8S1YQW8_PAROT|nr:unnamed protein product [Paramecium octaurelia]
MKICLYQAVMIRLFSLGQSKLNGSVHKHSKIIKILFVHQVSLTNKIKLFLVDIKINLNN